MAYRTYRKVGTRKAQAISKVCFAAAADLDGRRRSRRPHRVRQRRAGRRPLPRAESVLRGRTLDDELAAAASLALAHDIAPIDDIRSSASVSAARRAESADTVSYRRRSPEDHDLTWRGQHEQGRGDTGHGWLIAGAPVRRGSSPLRTARDIEAALAKVSPSLVRIHVVTYAYEEGRELKREASGSGTIITPEGHVLTNHHVAGRTRSIICTLANREEIPADLVGTDPLSDIAILKLRPAKPRTFPAARFGDVVAGSRSATASWRSAARSRSRNRSRWASSATPK